VAEQLMQDHSRHRRTGNGQQWCIKMQSAESRAGTFELWWQFGALRLPRKVFVMCLLHLHHRQWASLLVGVRASGLVETAVGLLDGCDGYAPSTGWGKR